MQRAPAEEEREPDADQDGRAADDFESDQPPATPNTPTTMVAEKAADLIKEEDDG